MLSDKTKTRTLVISILGGALLGVGIGSVINNRKGENERAVSISAGDGISLAFMILGFIRQISHLLDNNDQSA